MVSPLNENYATWVHCCQPSLTLICAVPIHSVFKDILMRRLGADFHQLGLSMNLPRTDIDDIRDTPGINLRMKIDRFLSKYKFPAFTSDRETAEFLVKTLQRVSLPGIVAEVKRDLEHKLDIEGDSLCVQPYIIFCHKSDYMSCFFAVF